MGKAASGKRAAKEGGTRGHTVPQMYLRHFARHVARRKYELKVRRLDKVDEPFPVTPTGIGCRDRLLLVAGTAFSGLWHRSWGVVAERHHVSRLKRSGPCPS